MIFALVVYAPKLVVNISTDSPTVKRSLMVLLNLYRLFQELMDGDFVLTLKLTWVPLTFSLKHLYLSKGYTCRLRGIAILLLHWFRIYVSVIDHGVATAVMKHYWVHHLNQKDEASKTRTSSMFFVCRAKPLLISINSNILAVHMFNFIGVIGLKSTEILQILALVRAQGSFPVTAKRSVISAWYKRMAAPQLKGTLLIYSYILHQISGFISY